MYVCMVTSVTCVLSAYVGNSPVNNGMATIIFDGLNCSVVYNITAGGILNGTLVGPRYLHGTITAGPCPLNSITTISATGTYPCTHLHKYYKVI